MCGTILVRIILKSCPTNHLICRATHHMKKGRYMERTTGNYAALCETWREKILHMDMEELKRRFHLREDESAYYITYFCEKYRIDKGTASLTLAKDPDGVLGFNTQMSIYNLFFYSKPGAKVKGEFVPFRLVKRASPFEGAFLETVLKPLAKIFSGRTEQLRAACRSLQGEKLPQGDVGYVLHAFDWMPVAVLFWDGDDEFEAQANLLFDADITDFIHEETVCCIAADVIRRLTEEAGMKEKEQYLGDQY